MKRSDMMMENYMEREMQKLLYSKGVFRHYQGYDYFVRSVQMVQEKPECIQHIYKEIYFEIANEVGKDVRAIERDIRTVRDVFFKNGGEKLLAHMCGIDTWNRNRPYPGEMIEIFATYLQNRKK